MTVERRKWKGKPAIIISRALVLLLAATVATQEIEGLGSNLPNCHYRPTSKPWRTNRVCNLRNRCCHTLLSAAADNSDDATNDNNDNPLEAMRRLLENSWDATTMGRVPLDATAGANEVYAALMEAESLKNSGYDNSPNNVFFVELLLPAYDISQGERLYDEVMAVEFCISLTKTLKGKSQILVRDQKTLDTVEKVLLARASLEKEDDSNEYDDDDDDDEDDNPSSNMDDDEEITIGEEELDLFRKKLLLGLDGTGTDAAGTSVFGNDRSSKPSGQSSPSNPNLKDAEQSTRRYRLASLFGTARISTQGPDMPKDVVGAVRNNALAMEDEDTVILLSARGKDEMVAVRALVDKYQRSKRMILVNCDFSPMPTELQQAEIVYSIQPLVAKETDSGKDLSLRGDGDGSSKVVVLRRFPKDWEIFVDIGNGFELAETMQIRPTIQAITESLQRYLNSV